MTEKLKNLIKEEMLKLPKEAQEAINSLDWGNVAEEIGKKYLLNESEINDFQVETFLILAGIEYPEAYIANIENEVGTTKADAEKIAEEVLQKIFVPLGNALTENIKKNGKVENGNAEQNLNFILSGGDYSVFLEVPPSPTPPDLPLSGETNGFPPDKGEHKGVQGEREDPVVPVFSLREENFKK
jgi:hypothetical protein